MTARILRNFWPFFQEALLGSIYVGDLFGTSRRAVVSESVSSSKLVMLMFIINKRTTIFRELCPNSVLIKIKILLKYNQNLISFQRFNGFNNFNFHSKLQLFFTICEHIILASGDIPLLLTFSVGSKTDIEVIITKAILETLK